MNERAVRKLSRRIGAHPGGAAWWVEALVYVTLCNLSRLVQIRLGYKSVEFVVKRGPFRA